MPEYLGPFALGLFIGIVGTATALLAYVIVGYVEYEVFKDVRKTCPPKDNEQHRTTLNPEPLNPEPGAKRHA